VRCVPPPSSSSLYVEIKLYALDHIPFWPVKLAKNGAVTDIKKINYNLRRQ